MIWNDNNTITVTPPKRPKKITGTRFASIMGLNRWNTPFATWCEITKTYVEPFEDTIYTLAGKTIEPKQADYLENTYGFNVVRPSDIYGKDYFNKTYGDFFPSVPILGGMWDYLLADCEGNTTTVVEMKTTKRSEDWLEDIPEYYALQAALYAYLMNVDDVMMVASFLDDSDYENPDAFVPSIGNTVIYEFKVSERYPNMSELVQFAIDWYDKHVVGGVSPEYDEKADAKILKELRKNNINPQTEIQELVAEAEALMAEIDTIEATIADKNARLKTLKCLIKDYAMSQFRDGDKAVTLQGKYLWTLSKSMTTSIDKDKLKVDGLLEAYQTTTETYKLTTKEIN